MQVLGCRQKAHFHAILKFSMLMETWKYGAHWALVFRRYQSINNAPDENKRLEQLSWKMFVFFLLNSRWSFYGLKRNKFVLMLSIAHKRHLHKSRFMTKAEFVGKLARLVRDCVSVSEKLKLKQEKLSMKCKAKTNSNFPFCRKPLKSEYL